MINLIFFKVLLVLMIEKNANYISFLGKYPFFIVEPMRSSHPRKYVKVTAFYRWPLLVVLYFFIFI